jgi:hypothetical protein
LTQRSSSLNGACLGSSNLPTYNASFDSYTGKIDGSSSALANFLQLLPPSMNSSGVNHTY